MGKLKYLLPNAPYFNQKGHLYCPKTDDTLCRFISRKRLNIDYFFLAEKNDRADLCLRCQSNLEQYKNGTWELKHRAPREYSRIYIKNTTMDIVNHVKEQRGMSVESVLDTSIRLALPTLLKNK